MFSPMIGSLALFLLLIGSTNAALSFSASIRISNDPSMNGIMVGTIYYQSNSYNSYDVANKLKIVYNGVGNSTINEILKSSSTINQTIKYLFIGQSCDAQLYTTYFPYLEFDAGHFTSQGFDNSVSAYRFTTSGSLTDVFTIWYSSASGGTIVQAQFGNGKIWKFTNVTAIAIPASTFDNPSSCPTAECTVITDIVQVIDDSGSISNSMFNNAIKPFAIDVCKSYSWAAADIPGITMAGVFFSSSARTILGWTNSRESAIAAFNSTSMTTGSSNSRCISCGIEQATSLFNNRMPGRQSVGKIVFLLTYGPHNFPAGSTINSAVTASKSSGISTISIGVGTSYNISELSYIASNVPNVQTVYQTNFTSLQNIVPSVTAITCSTTTYSRCGSSCKGFCSVGRECICPQCDTSNLCSNGVCSIGLFGNGCTYSPTVCNDGNACTSDICIPSTGCVYSSNSSSCSTTDNCKIGSCNPTVGCVLADKVCTSSDPYKRSDCNPSLIGGCFLTDQNGTTCKIPLADGSRSPSARYCPDPNSQRQDERPDGNQCKDWYCDPLDSYLSDEYTPGNQFQIGRCKSVTRVCANNQCTNNTCISSTGLCPSNMTLSNICDDGNSCTKDSCTNGGCVNKQITISDCFALTGGVESLCYEYTLNTSLPTCCQVKNKGYNRCGANLTDSCLDWNCADDTGLCSYFTKDCSSQIQVDDCHFAQCFSNGTGCVASVLPNAQIDICGVCNGNGVCGTTTSPNSTTTTPPTTQSNTQANVNGGQKILFNSFEFVFVLIIFVAITFF